LTAWPFARPKDDMCAAENLMCRKAATGVMLLYLAGLAASGGGCWRSAAEGKSYPYKAVTTVAMVTDIVKNVAGDKAQVTGIIGEGVDPHLYKPTRDDMVTLMNADIIFYNGLMLEGKMADTLAKVSRDKPAFAVAEALDKEYLLAREGAAGHPDPHVWMDPSAWAQAVSNLATIIALCAPTLDHKVIVGRGIPTEWLQDGMSLRVENVPIANGKRFGYELRAFRDRVEFDFLGDAPDGEILVDLPIFNRSLVKTSAGTIDAVRKRVVLPTATRKATIHADIPLKGPTFPEYPLGYENLRFDNPERK